MRKITAAAFLLVLTAVAPARADSPTWERLGAENKEQCAKVDALPLPPQDMPDETTKAALKDCSAENLYYGIGMPKDYTAARQCAYMERDKGDDLGIGGSGILMMIYANGQGVAKNYDLATKFACDLGGALAEVGGRIKHIAELKTLAPGHKMALCATEKDMDPAFCSGTMDICDDITSGEMEGFCASIQSDKKDAERKAASQKFAASLTGEQKNSFAALQKAAQAYIQSYGDKEVDASGTARAAQELDAMDKLNEKFDSDLAAFEKGKPPARAADDFRKADAKLNLVYKQAIKSYGTPNVLHGTIEAAGIRDTQRVWLAYRDAWVSFAALRYPRVSPDAIKTVLTRERIKLLQDLLQQD